MCLIVFKTLVSGFGLGLKTGFNLFNVGELLVGLMTGERKSNSDGLIFIP
jgi:hypothetical protein